MSEKLVFEERRIFLHMRINNALRIIFNNFIQSGFVSFELKSTKIEKQFTNDCCDSCV